MTDEAQLAFVATLRDEASRQAHALRSTLDSLSGTTRAVAVPIAVRDEATAAIARVDEELALLGPAAVRAADEVNAAGRTAGRSFVDAAGRLRNADGTFAKAGETAGAAASAGLSKSSARGAEESGRRFGSIFSKASLGPLRAYGEAAAGFFAIDKVTEFVRGSVEAAREVAKAQALTAQVIKTTGGAAGVTASQVNELSDSIARSTGIDAAQIQTGARLLLTFRSVRNQLGAGNDVYDQAVRLGNDLAVSMGESQQSAAMQLGKALNDPTRGLAMLNRVGIQFTAGQTARIQGYMKEGNLLAAQKIILGEVGKEFGGSAAAASTSAGRMSEAFRQLRVEAGTALLGALGSIEDAVAGHVIPALDATPRAIHAIVAGLATFGAAMLPGLRDVGSTLVDVVRIVVALQRVLAPLERFSLAVLVAAFRAVAAVVAPVAHLLATVATAIADNRTAATVLAVVIGAMLVPAIARWAAAMAAAGVAKLAPLVYSATVAVSGLVGAFREAGGGVKGFGSAIAAINLNPVSLALTAIVAVAAVGFMRAAAAARAGKAESDAFAASLNTSKTSLDSLNSAASSTRTYLLNVVKAGVSAAGGFDKFAGKVAEAASNVNAAQTAAATARSNVAELGRTYGMTAAQVQALADANNLDLTASYAALSPQVKAALDAIALTHHPTRQAAADVKALGGQASTAADDVQALTNQLALMAGDSLSADQAANAFASDIRSLDKALKASHGSLSRNSAAGLAARDAFDTSAQGAINAAQAEAKLKNGTDRAQATLQREIDTLRKHAGNSDYARAAIERLQHAQDQLPGSADAAASGLEHAGARIEAQAKREAAAAARAMADGRSAAETAGSRFGGGYALGIAKTAAAAGVAAAGIVQRAISAVDRAQRNGSPSKIGRDRGLRFGVGYALGLAASVPQVTAASLKVVESVVSSFSSSRASLASALHGVAAAIRGALVDSRKATAKELDGLLQTVRSHLGAMRRSLTNEAGTLHDRAATLRGEAARTKDAAARRRYVAELAKVERQRKVVLDTRAKLDAEEAAAVGTLRATTGRLEGLATRRERIAGRLAAAQSRLQGLQAAKADLESSIRGSVASFSALTTITPPNDAPVTAGFIVSGLQERLAAVRRFAANVRTLIHRHVNRNLIRQILSEGPDQGGAYAAALASATDQQLDAADAAQDSIDKVGKRLADYAGHQLYDSGIKAAQGLVDGLRKRERQLDAIARELGRKISKAIKDELGIHSPSRRLREEVGAMVPAGVADGIAGRTYLAEAAAAKLAARVAKAATVDLPAVGQGFSDLALPPVQVQRTVVATVELRHRVTFDQPEVAARLSAAQVADLLARDPQSSERIERTLTPLRGRIAATVVSASR